MADPRFFTNAGPFRLGDLAGQIGAELAPGADADLLLSDVAPLEQAGAGQLSFLDNKKYVPAFVASKAAACIINPALQSKAPPGMALLLAADPYRAYARAASLFYPAQQAAAGIHPAAVVDPAAVLGDGVSVAAGAVIGARAEIGAGCQIGPNAVIGDGVVLGAGTIVGANASLSHCLVGARCYLYPGCRIGQDGFGFAMGPQGHLKVPQLGRVVIGDDVEIGANATIDRGAGPDTIIGAGSRVDNLVQIAHNVQIGRNCVIVAQVGISGSSKLGNFVIVAGQAGLTGHLTIGDGVKVAAQSGVMRDVAAGETVGGSPAVPMTEWLRQSALLHQMARKKSR